MVLQRKLRSSIARVNVQLDPRHAASKHTTAPINHTRPSWRQTDGQTDGQTDAQTYTDCRRSKFLKTWAQNTSPSHRTRYCSWLLMLLFVLRGRVNKTAQLTQCHFTVVRSHYFCSTWSDSCPPTSDCVPALWRRLRRRPGHVNATRTKYTIYCAVLNIIHWLA